MTQRNFTKRIQRLLAACSVAGVLGLSSIVIAAEPVPTYEWLPAEAAAGSLAANEAGTPQVVLPVTHTKTPKVTADASKFTKTYTIDLKKFNISNTGTDAVSTTRGLNQALQDAKAQGANHIVFPKGTYLITETEPVVIDHKDTIIDLNGATLQINTNGLQEYSMVDIVNGAENIRLTNGTLRGDRDTHDYTTTKGAHEDCTLLTLHSGRGIEVDNLVVTNAPGFAIASRANGARNRPELLAKIFHSVMIKDIEKGAFSEAGAKVDDATKTRSSKPYDVSTTGGEFEFGYMAGYYGFPFIKDRNYQVLFFDAEMKFLGKRRVHQYRKVAVPAGAKFVHLEFNQGEVSEEPAHSGASRGGWAGRITNFRPPTDVHFHNNTISNNRALGMAFCGGQKWILENNLWEGNGGQAPSYAIDFEDGWEMMQDVVFRNNIFKKNHHDMVVCAGSELLFENNQFEKQVVFYGRVYNYTVRKNRFVGGGVHYSTRSGVADIRDNHYQDNIAIAIVFDGKGVADGLMRAPGQAVATPALTLTNETFSDVKQVTGTYFKVLRSKLDNVRFIAGKTTVLADFSGSELNNTTLVYEKTGPDVHVNLNNSKGALREEGPGVGRKKTMQAKP